MSEIVGRASNICCIDKTTMCWAAVSLKTDHTDFGLPGGKLESNETFPEAAVRELFEETGLLVEQSDLSVLIHEIDDHRYECTTFIVTNFTGSLNSSENAALAWLPIDDLLKSRKYHQTCTKVHTLLKNTQF